MADFSNSAMWEIERKKTRHLFSFASNLCWSIGREAVTGAKNSWKPEFNELALGGASALGGGGKSRYGWTA